VSRYINSVPFIQDGNGKPIVGAKKFFFNQGTTTIKSIYSDSGLTIVAANPVESDEAGRFPDIFLDGLYKEVQKDADGVTLWTRDPIGEISTGPFDAWDTSIIYATSQIVLGSDNEYYRSLIDSNTGNDPVLSLGNWEKLNLGRIWESSKTYGVGDSAYGSNGFLYTSRLAANTGNDPTSDTTNWQPATEWKLPKGADIASATTLVLGDDGLFFDVTGTTAITAITTKGVGTQVTLQFDGILTLTHQAADLILPGAANITTAAGDIAIFYEYAAGDWQCVNYEKADGTSVISATGMAVQVVNTTDSAVATGTTVIPYDDTIPQNTEGDEYITLAITPTSAANKLKIEVVMNITSSAAGTTLGVALFQDSTADALAAIADSGVLGIPENISFIHYMTAGTALSTTFKIHAGANLAGTTTFNGQASARRYGGVYASSITITEVKV